MADETTSSETIASLRRALRITQLLALLALLGAGAALALLLRPTRSITLEDGEFVTELEPGRLRIRAVGGSHRGVYLGTHAGSKSIFSLSMDESFQVSTSADKTWSADFRLGTIQLSGETVQMRAQGGIPAELSVGGVDDGNWVSMGRGSIRLREKPSDGQRAPTATLEPSTLFLNSGGEDRAHLNANGTLSFKDGNNDGYVDAEAWRYLKGLHKAAKTAAERR